MTRFLEFIGKLWPLFATLGLLGGIVWYFANLDGRVRELEQRVHTLAIAPIIADQSPTATSQTLIEPIVVPNPVEAVPLEIALPGANFLDRQGVALESLVERQRAAVQRFQ